MFSSLLEKKEITPSLSGENIFLRFPEKEDVQQWVSVRKENKKFLEPWTPVWSKEMLTSAYFDLRLKRQLQDWKEDKNYSFLIFKKETEELMGGINITRVTRGVAQMGTLGYWMAERHTCNGYMTEAITLVIDFAFSELKLHRLEAGCLPYNTSSRKVLEKCGFTKEGLARSYLKIAGKWQDHVLYGLISNKF